MTEEIIKKVEFPDSVELGTPSKGGVMKVYFNASNLDETKKRIDNAAEALNYALSVKATVVISDVSKS